MKRLKLKFLILFCIFHFTLGDPNQRYGSTCNLEDGSVGFCTDIANCPTIKNLLMNQLITLDRIIICNKSLRYMCCPFSAEETTETSTILTIATTKKEQTTAKVLTTTQEQLGEIGK